MKSFMTGLVLSLVFLSGCASQADLEQLEGNVHARFSEIDEIHRRMLILHQAEFKAAKETRERVDVLDQLVLTDRGKIIQ
jgi:outer membrane murein-binding lipoprotein Lpp